MLELTITSLPELYTTNLVLRSFQKKDIPLLFALRTNPVAMQYIDRPLPKDIEETEQMYQRFKDGEKNHTLLNWVITYPGEDKLLGFIGFFSVDKENHRAEIGYMLFPEYFKKGIMHEAIGAVTEYGFTTLKLHSICANINPANLASAKLLEKNNFVQEAYFKENYYFNGKFLDSIIYAKLCTRANP